MAISNETARKLYKRAAGNYAQKLKLETKNIKPVRKVFNKVLSDFQKSYAAYGHPPHLEHHRALLEKGLKDIHQSTAKKFSGQIREVLGKPHNAARVSQRLDAHIKGFAAQRSHLMAHQITDTTRKNMDTAIKRAKEEAEKEEASLSNKSIASRAKDILKERFDARSIMISITETQAAAESGKSLEYETLSETNAEFDGVNINEMKAQKMWVTILDDHTREWHAEVDGDVVDAEEPFEVNGEEMMFPGDDSLGASEDNLVNCRCCHETFFE